MDMYRRGLQTKRKLFFKFDVELLVKNKKYSNKWRGVNIDQGAMWYISMDSSQQALQTNGKLSSNLKLVFKLLAKKYSSE